MIITIIALAMVIIGIILLCTSTDNMAVYTLGFALGVAGSLITLIAVTIIICEHVGVNTTVEENRITYEALCERNEIISSEYEDVSKSDVIEDIAEWNKMVYSYKYWTYNPWTNWFHSKRVADKLQMIERSK